MKKHSKNYIYSSSYKNYRKMKKRLKIVSVSILAFIILCLIFLFVEAIAI